MNDKTIKITLANCAIHNGNRGCLALTVSSMHLIKSLLKERGYACEFTLPQSGFPQDGVQTVSMGGEDYVFRTVCDVSRRSLKARLKYLVRYKRAKAGRKAYEDADFILDIGQGDSFSDIYGKNRFDWINGSYVLGRKYGKPYCVLPQTIGPYADEKVRDEAVRSLAHAHTLMVRDRQSYDLLRKLVPNRDVTEVIDVAFFMPYRKKTFSSDCVHVGLNVSALLWNGGYTRNNQFGLTVDYPAFVRSVIDEFLRMDNVMLHLIPHVVGDFRNVENDYEVSYDLCEEYNSPRLVLSPLFLDPIAAKGYIAGMDFFMGARMHSTIAAFSSGVPVVPMAYSRKFNGLFVDTLDYPDMVDLKTQTNGEALRTVMECFGRRDEEKRMVDDRMNGVVKERKEVLTDSLKKFFGGWFY